MSDRINSVTVVFEKDIHEDDIKYYVDAIKMIKGVISVKQNVTDHNLYIAEARENRRMAEKLYKVIEDLNKTTL